MLQDVANGRKFVKQHIYKELSTHIGRSIKSIEYRMQNISYVYFLMGRNWVPGLKPAKNIGSKNVAIIEKLISELEGQKLNTDTEFESKALYYRANLKAEAPLGVGMPASFYAQVTKFHRDPKVKAWVLNSANGTCECCERKAPFETFDGQLFLEVHHLRELAEGGSDTISNTVAICPNCHRELHHGARKKVLIDNIYKKISRLVRE